jgi:hypothetical protein
MRSIQGKAVDVDDIIREIVGPDVEIEADQEMFEGLGFSDYEELRIELEEEDYSYEEGGD